MASAHEAADYANVLHCSLGHVKVGGRYFDCLHWTMAGTCFAAMTPNDCFDLVTGNDFAVSERDVNGFLDFAGTGSWSLDRGSEKRHRPLSAR